MVLSVINQTVDINSVNETEMEQNYFISFALWLDMVIRLAQSWNIKNKKGLINKQLRKESVKIQPDGIRTHDICDTGAVLYQLSYQANWELVIRWVLYIPA